MNNKIKQSIILVFVVLVLILSVFLFSNLNLSVVDNDSDLCYYDPLVDQNNYHYKNLADFNLINNANLNENDLEKFDIIQSEDGLYTQFCEENGGKK